MLKHKISWKLYAYYSFDYDIWHWKKYDKKYECRLTQSGPKLDHLRGQNHDFVITEFLSWQMFGVLIFFQIAFILWKDEGKQPTMIFWSACFSLTMTLNKNLHWSLHISILNVNCVWHFPVVKVNVFKVILTLILLFLRCATHLCYCSVH